MLSGAPVCARRAGKRGRVRGLCGICAAFGRAASVMIRAVRENLPGTPVEFARRPGRRRGSLIWCTVSCPGPRCRFAPTSRPGRFWILVSPRALRERLGAGRSRAWLGWVFLKGLSTGTQPPAGRRPTMATILRRRGERPCQGSKSYAERGGRGRREVCGNRRDTDRAPGVRPRPRVSRAEREGGGVLSPGKVRRGGALMLRNVEPSGRTEKPLWASPNAPPLSFFGLRDEQTFGVGRNA